MRQAKNPLAWTGRIAGAALAALLTLGCAFAQSGAAPARNTGSEAAPAEQPEPDALHVVYDASESMCGFFGAKDELDLFKKILDILQVKGDGQSTVKSMLIRERNKNHIEEAEAEFHRKPRGNGCEPLDGVDSNPVVIFDRTATPRPARSLLLVSDMQLSPESRSDFVTAFENWYRNQSDASAVRAGILTLAVPFKGKYFPISGSSKSGQKTKVASIALPQHDRPLSLLWFTANDDDATHLATLLSSVRELAGAERVLAQMQFAPALRLAPERWFQSRPGTLQGIFGTEVQLVPRPDPARSDKIRGCVGRARFVDDELRFEVNRQCKDGKPFFSGTTALTLLLPLNASLDYAVAIEGDAAGLVNVSHEGNSIGLTLRKVPSKPLVLPIGLTLTNDVLPTKSLDLISLNEERCAPQTPKSGKDAACASTFDRRTYRYTQLVTDLAQRAHAVRKQPVAPNGSTEAPLTLTIVVEEGRTR